MSRALLVTGLAIAPRSRIEGYIAAMRDAGVDIDLIVCQKGAAFELPQGVCRVFPPRPRQPRRPTPVRQIRGALRLVTQRRDVDLLRRSVLRMPDLDEWVARADVIVALDQPGVDVVWHLARRYPTVPAVLGIPAALRVLASR